MSMMTRSRYNHSRYNRSRDIGYHMRGSPLRQPLSDGPSRVLCI